MKKIVLALGLIGLLNANSNNTVADPFSQMDKIFELQMKQMELMQKQMDSVFKNMQNSNGSFPTVTFNSNSLFNSGLQDKGDHYEIAINTSKDTKTDLNIQTKDNLLTIKVEQHKEIKKDSNTSKIQSISTSSYMQTLTLPSDADASKITNENKDGKIIIKIPKKK